MHPAYYHMAHACIMCFDVTRKQACTCLVTHGVSKVPQAALSPVRVLPDIQEPARLVQGAARVPSWNTCHLCCQ